MHNPTIPPDLRDRMNREKVYLDQTGKYGKITVMFVDMRGFSHLLVKQKAKRVIKLLDLYFSILATTVRQHGGVVDKFMGDGMMAVWGLPAGRKDDSYRAARAAIDIRLGMFRIIPELVRLGEVPLEIGVGLGTGPALVGFVGPKNRRTYTLVGDCINRAARLEGGASNNRIFLDEPTAEEVRTCSYLVYVVQDRLPATLSGERVFELEGIYDFNPQYESSRRHPRLVVARVAGITNIKTNARKPALIKSVGEGGLGVEMHDFPDFSLKVGDETAFDSSDLRVIDLQDVRGQVIRKLELKEKGIFRVKTWDIGVKFRNIPEDARRNLLKIETGSRRMRDIIQESGEQ
jgi:class 3 adenylate cyclase